ARRGRPPISSLSPSLGPNRPDRSSDPSRSAAGEGILADGKLLVGNGQLAPGGRNDLGVHGAIHRVRQEANRAVAEGEVASARMATGRVREGPLEREVLAITDILKGPDLVGLAPGGRVVDGAILGRRPERRAAIALRAP